jgi:hypothetical protein
MQRVRHHCPVEHRQVERACKIAGDDLQVIRIAETDAIVPFQAVQPGAVFIDGEDVCGGTYQLAQRECERAPARAEVCPNSAGNGIISFSILEPHNPA